MYKKNTSITINFHNHPPTLNNFEAIASVKYGSLHHCKHVQTLNISNVNKTNASKPNVLCYE